MNTACRKAAQCTLQVRSASLYTAVLVQYPCDAHAVLV
jgi:hypothetical protein